MSFFAGGQKHSVCNRHLNDVTNLDLISCVYHCQIAHQFHIKSNE